jgi:hypothetical protein
MLDLTPNAALPTWSRLNAMVEDLPFGMAGLVRGAINARGTTPDHLLLIADACDEARKEIATLFPGGVPDHDHWTLAAEILRAAAARLPIPPREPATPPIDARTADRTWRAAR